MMNFRYALYSLAVCFLVCQCAMKPNDANVHDKEALKKKLTPEQYSCTQEAGTEAPFKNPYWNNKADGLYVDVVSGEVLFSSLDKYDSGTGWPSFTKPIQNNLVFKQDHKLGMQRTEVRSATANSHLGHVFDDGPSPTGKRYCINSASMQFIPLDKLKEKNLGSYLFDFVDKQGWDIATLAGGCFWGMENLLKDIPGVVETRVGYTGGKAAHVTYEDVHTGTTQHAETVQILFDPKRVSYKDLLLFFFKIHDPTSQDKQGNDIGSQYRSSIFYRTQQQHDVAVAVKQQVDKSKQWKKPVVTQIVPLQQFWLAEEEHQHYLQKHPDGYTCHYVRPLNF